MADNTAHVARGIFEELVHDTLPEWGRMEAATKLVSVAPGDYLFWTEDIHPFVYCVRQGLLKLVYDTSDGREWIKAFVAEKSFFASANALMDGGRTTFSVVAMEATVVERLDYRVIQRLAESHHCWQKMLTNAFTLYGARKEKRERELLTLSAEERYRSFLYEYPALRRRIPQQDLARYLGVTPVGLSRIRSRLEGKSSDKIARHTAAVDQS